MEPAFFVRLFFQKIVIAVIHMTTALGRGETALPFGNAPRSPRPAPLSQIIRTEQRRKAEHSAEYPASGVLTERSF